MCLDPGSLVLNISYRIAQSYMYVVVVVYFHKLKSYSITTLHICMEPEINASGMLLSLGPYNTNFDAYKANIYIFTRYVMLCVMASPLCYNC